MQGTPKFVLQRLLLFLPTLFGALTLVFFLMHLVPGDPVDLMVGETAQGVDKEALRKNLGLDRPLIEQYGAFLADLVHFDLGESYFHRRPVTGLILERLKATAALAAVALFVSSLLAIPLGVFAAVSKRRSVAAGAQVFGLLGLSMPNFWLGPLLILLLAIQFDLLPVSGWESPSSIILPAITLGGGMAALLMRMTRSSVMEERTADYVRTARAKGVAESQVVTAHILRNALTPMITVIGLQVGILLSGAVITETIFSWPGVGRLLIGAIQTRDYPLLQGCVLFIVLVYLFVNLAVDLLYVVANPTVRFAEERS